MTKTVDFVAQITCLLPGVKKVLITKVDVNLLTISSWQHNKTMNLHVYFHTKPEKSVVMNMCVREINIASVYTICPLDFRTNPTMLYLLVFHFIIANASK